LGDAAAVYDGKQFFTTSHNGDNTVSQFIGFSTATRTPHVKQFIPLNWSVLSRHP